MLSIGLELAMEGEASETISKREAISEFFL